MTRSNQEKYDTVIQKNTYYFVNDSFESEYESHIVLIRDTLLNLQREIKNVGATKELFVKVIMEKEIGLTSLLALTGVSNEFFKRIITLIRIVDDQELSKLVLKEKWAGTNNTDTKEWSDDKITALIKNNPSFSKGIINLFFEGSTVPFLTRTIPTFELKKLSITKLQFELPEILDSLARYKEKGSYSGKTETNPESVIKKLLKTLNVNSMTGDLKDLVTNAHDTKRTMDFIIPNKTHPKIIIESSYLKTTSSGQGDKSKTEIAVHNLLKKHYPEAKFIGFVDGIGWYVRKGDLGRMVAAYDDVFTFHADEMERFKNFLIKTLDREHMGD